MSRRVLLALVAAAVAVRIVALFGIGNPFDMNTFEIVAGTLFSPGRWHLYADPSLLVKLYANEPSYIRWPYPGGYLPVVGAAQWTAAHLGGPFDVLIRLPALVLDFAVAAVLHRIVRPQGERAALCAALLVLLGPAFIALSSLHGQLDTAAMLPVLLALHFWRGATPGVRRGLVAGGLIGLGAAVKSFPVVFVLALLPTATNRREVLALASATIAVVFVSVAPFLLAEPRAVVSALSYGGVVGLGGVSMLLQPHLVEAAYAQHFQPELSGLSHAAAHAALPLTAIALAAAAVWLRRRREDPFAAGVLICGVIFVVGLNFAFQYGLWAVLLLAAQGRIRAAVATQGALCVPAFFAYTALPLGGIGRLPVDLVYLPIMAALPFVFLALGVRGAQPARYAA